MNTRPVAPGGLVAAMLRAPARAAGLSTRGWEQLIREARNSELMGQLCLRLEGAGALHTAPARASVQLHMGWQLADRHAQAVAWELDHVHAALQPVGVPVILLKGAAYAALQSRSAQGRVFNDLDILVPRTALQRVEERLMRAGWLPSHSNAYDERYYREWMHEIPPMEHKYRSSVLDVHHALLPPTSGIHPDAERLFESSGSVGARWPAFHVLGPEDRVIHSACHLFFGEFHKGLRDLYDLHCLMSEGAPVAGFWERLVARAQGFGLLQPVCDALRHARAVFGTAVPDATLRDAGQRAGAAWKRRALHPLFERVLQARTEARTPAGTRLAHWLVFARSHWLRMPLPLLAYHLSYKFFTKP